MSIGQRLHYCTAGIRWIQLRKNHEFDASFHFYKKCHSYTPPRVSKEEISDRLLESVFESTIGVQNSLQDIRKKLHFGVKDSLITQLSEAGSVQAVMDLLRTHDGILDHLHTSQALATLFYLQKVCSHVMNYHNNDVDHRYVRLEFNRILSTFPTYIKLLEQVETHFHHLNLTVIAYIFLCMHKMNQSLASDVMRSILIHLKQRYDYMDLTALSYLSEVFPGRNNRVSKLRDISLFGPLTLAPALGRLRHFVDVCDSPEEVSKIAVCFNAASSIVSDDLMQAFSDKVLSLIKRDVFVENADSLDALVKVLALCLTMKDWHFYRNAYTRTVLQQFIGRVGTLMPLQALIVAKAVVEHGQPVELFCETNRILCRMYNDDYSDWIGCALPKIDILAVIVAAKIRRFKKSDLESIIFNGISKPNFHLCISQYFDILRSSNINNPNLISSYLEAAFSACLPNPADLRRLSLRYTNFNSVEGGVSRCHVFEQKLVNHFLTSSQSCPLTVDFAIQFGFIIAYANEQSIPRSLMNKFHRMLPNMNAFSLYCLARGLEVRISWSNPTRQYYKYRKSQSFHPLFEEIELALNLASKSLLGTSHESRDVCQSYDTIFHVLRSFVARRHFMETCSFNFVVDRMASALSLVINSTQLLDLSLSAFRLLISCLSAIEPVYETPQILRLMIEYMTQQAPYAHAIYFVKLINLSYLSNHPIENKTFLTLVDSVLHRDLYDGIIGLYVLESAISLVFYRSLSRDLCRAIFSAKFMDQLDGELSECKDNKSSYVIRLRRTLMELNRAVCLEYPQYDIPWFHEKYCLTDSSRMLDQNVHRIPYKFREEIYQGLGDVLSGYRNIRDNILSLYFNSIDFEIILDQKIDQRRQPDISVARKATLDSFGGRRLAFILCRHEESYTQDTGRLLGILQHSDRQLEQQGYRVIRINSQKWSSLSMSPSAKREYLRLQLRSS